MKKYYIIKFKGRFVKKYGVFRNKENAKILVRKIHILERPDYSIHTIFDDIKK